MCTKVAEVDPWQLYYVPDHFKTQEMCNKGVRDHFFSLQYVPDWFVAQQQIKIWYGDSEYDDDDDDDDDDDFIKWYDGYKNGTLRKRKLKKS